MNCARLLRDRDADRRYLRSRFVFNQTGVEILASFVTAAKPRFFMPGIDLKQAFNRIKTPIYFRFVAKAIM